MPIQCACPRVGFTELLDDDPLAPYSTRKKPPIGFIHFSDPEPPQPEPNHNHHVYAYYQAMDEYEERYGYSHSDDAGPI